MSGWQIAGTIAGAWVAGMGLFLLFVARYEALDRLVGKRRARTAKPDLRLVK